MTLSRLIVSVVNCVDWCHGIACCRDCRLYVMVYCILHLHRSGLHHTIGVVYEVDVLALTLHFDTTGIPLSRHLVCGRCDFIELPNDSKYKANAKVRVGGCGLRLRYKSRWIGDCLIFEFIIVIVNGQSFINCPGGRTNYNHKSTQVSPYIPT